MINVRALEEVIEVLTNEVDPREFDLRFWRHDSRRCGSVCCAVGSYIMKRPNCGLQLLSIGSSFFEVRASDAAVEPAEARAPDLAEDWRLVAYHFGITRRRSFWLFNGDSYLSNRQRSLRGPDREKLTQAIRPARVVARIRKFLAQHSLPLCESTRPCVDLGQQLPEDVHASSV